MRALALCLAVLILLAPSTQGLTEVRGPDKVNKLLKYGTFSTPMIEPGGTGVLSFDFNNPYNASMTNVVLKVGIYHYAEQEVSMIVDDNWSWDFPRFQGAPGRGREATITYASLSPNESHRVSITILTSTDMPHGGVFNQGAYFVRFLLTFTYNGSPARMASPGHWSKEQFMYATEEGELCRSIDCVGQVNLSRLGGIDGILPDTAFGVKDMIPMWPMYALAALAVFFTVLAFLFYAEEYPSKFPKSARAFAQLKGKLARVFRPRRKEKTSKP